MISKLGALARLSRMASADLLLHPVRLRIIKAFLGERALTTAQLAAELDDVPPGSLYRHVALLAREECCRWSPSAASAELSSAPTRCGCSQPRWDPTKPRR